MCSLAVIQISSSPVDAKRDPTGHSLRAGEMDVLTGSDPDLKPSRGRKKRHSLRAGEMDVLTGSDPNLKLSRGRRERPNREVCESRRDGCAHGSDPNLLLSSPRCFPATLLLDPRRRSSSPGRYKADKRRRENYEFLIIIESYHRHEAEVGRRPPVDKVNKIQILQGRLCCKGSHPATPQCGDVGIQFPRLVHHFVAGIAWLLTKGNYKKG